MVCGMAIWFTVNGHGPFGQWSTNIAMLLLLAYTSTLVVTGIALGGRDARARAGDDGVARRQG